MQFRVTDCRGDTTLSVFEGDIRDGDFLRKACRGASVVFHIASIIDVNDSVEYSEMYGVNVKGEASNYQPSVWIHSNFMCELSTKDLPLMDRL